MELIYVRTDGEWYFLYGVTEDIYTPLMCRMDGELFEGWELP